MSVVSIPIVNRNYPMGCEDGQEGRLIELGRIVDARARQILDKIGPLQENALLATLCIVLVDEIQNKKIQAKCNEERIKYTDFKEFLRLKKAYEEGLK